VRETTRGISTRAPSAYFSKVEGGRKFEAGIAQSV
jgi:hypothetical protein